MPLYEHKTNGKVTERVRTADNSLEDTRLGLAAAEKGSGWRLVDEAKPAADNRD